MDETILRSHNSVVGKQDKVYVLGDVTFRANKRFYEIMDAMNGILELIIGNNDNWEDLSGHFKSVRLWKKFSNVPVPFIASHVHIPKSCLTTGEGKIWRNVHGHIHEKNVMKTDRYEGVDTKTGEIIRFAVDVEDIDYLNVGVEQMGYQPIHLEDVQALLSLCDNEQTSIH